MAVESIAVVGLGYIGLPTAALFAAAGRQVIGVDINPATVETINSGRIHIVEPGLNDIVAACIREGRLQATTKAQPADAFLIAVPTPFRSDHTADLQYVRSACEAIAPVLKPGDTLILESTCPVGTTEQMVAWLSAARPDLALPSAQAKDATSDIAIAYCPERVLPGNVLVELVRNDRVIGGISPACAAAAKAVYETFVQGECLLTDARTAEMCKLTENAFRDVNIAFANELSLVCDRLGIDVWSLIALANRHPRVNILRPGPGVGGHCIACDPWFIVSSAPDQAQLIRTAREVNDGKPRWVVRQITMAIDRLDGSPAARPVLACYGLSFKADIDDLRDSPALAIAREIASEDRCSLLIVEPHVVSLPTGLEHAKLVSIEEASQADIHVLLVDHSDFKKMRPPAGVRIDTRGIGW